MEAGDHAARRRAGPRRALHRPADVPARRRGRLGGRAAARAGDDPAARAGDAGRGRAAPGRARAGRGRAGRARRDRRRAVPRVRAPAADGGPRGRRATRPRRCGRSRSCARCCARSSARRPGPAAMAVFERVLRGEPPPVHRVAGAGRRGRPGRWEPSPWPAPLAAAVDRHALVGRGVELAYLERCWREAAEGQRALVLLAGDAGIGKTRQRGRAGRRAPTTTARSCSTGASTRRR